MLSRRKLLKTLFLAQAIGLPKVYSQSKQKQSMSNTGLKKIRIDSVDSNFEREALIRPFGFKGGFVTELWQPASFLQSASGIKKVGLSTQSILWSDPGVYAQHSESGGNALMYALTEYALQLVKGRTFQDPIELQEQIFDEVYQYGIKITANPNLRKTFILNALVSIDNAAWMLYAAENKIATFDEMIPEKYRAALSHRHSAVASLPLISYNTPVSEIAQMTDSGYFFLKIKLGHPGSQADMLTKDMEKISAIHKAVGNSKTPNTASGKVLYYLDANGRYEKKETLLRFIDHAKKIGALDQIAIIEEPFDEESRIDVSDVQVRLAADESAHTDKDVLERIQMGYKAIALKAVAKTLSMTMGMVKAAKEHNIPCFCADLTVNPILVDWNKNVAARLDPFPGLTAGLLESNGRQNYKNWSTMANYHPYPGASWSTASKGVFNVDKNFYDKSGGVLSDSAHYMDMFNKNLLK